MRFLICAAALAGALVAPAAATAASSPYLWATINHCDVAGSSVGIRASMPGNGTSQRMYMRFSAQYRNAAGRYVETGSSTRWIKVGTARTRSVQSGYDFVFAPPPRGHRAHVPRHRRLPLDGPQGQALACGPHRRAAHQGRGQGRRGQRAQGRLGGHLRDRALEDRVTPAAAHGARRQPGQQRQRADRDGHPEGAHQQLDRVRQRAEGVVQRAAQAVPPAPAAPPSSSPEASVTEMAA